MLTTINDRPATHHVNSDRSAKKSVTFFEFCRHQLNGIKDLSYMHTPLPFFGYPSTRTLQLSRRKPSNFASANPFPIEQLTSIQ
jgi:hypothetical protein